MFLAFKVPLTDVHAVISRGTFIGNAASFGGGLSVDIGGKSVETKNVTWKKIF